MGRLNFHGTPPSEAEGYERVAYKNVALVKMSCKRKIENFNPALNGRPRIHAAMKILWLLPLLGLKPILVGLFYPRAKARGNEIFSSRAPHWAHA